MIEMGIINLAGLKNIEIIARNAKVYGRKIANKEDATFKNNQ